MGPHDSAGFLGFKQEVSGISSQRRDQNKYGVVRVWKEWRHHSED